MHEAKTHLSRLLDEVAQGVEVEITNRGRTVARLVPAPPGTKRQLGMFAGRVWVSPDFDAPMDDEFMAAFDEPLS